MSILEKILVKTRETVAASKQTVSMASVQQAASEAAAPRDFYGALADPVGIRLIAEVKKASPSAGVIREPFNPIEIATTYSASGAACISVLTDHPFFQGHLKYLRQIRQATELPLLRKDFIIDPYQVYEARAAGADCVLLIAECLDPSELIDLHELAVSLGMETLIELYDPENLPAVLNTRTRLVGVNNRDLRSFKTDLEHTVKLRQQIPNDRLVVGESGIRTHADLLRLQAAGVKAVLVGESLMRQQDIQAAVQCLLGISR